jgi:uncharacterized protein
MTNLMQECEARLREVLDAPPKRRAPTKERLLLKASTTFTDEGVFSAVISTATSDREKDIVEADAMVNALHKWMATGKQIPLAWGHSTAPEYQIGSVDPSSAKNLNSEVVVSGWIDQAVEAGAHAWRLVKSGVLGFSFGYLIPEGGATTLKGGGRHITELDVFEVTATTVPMNGETRVLTFKSTDREPPSLDELQERERDLGLEDPAITKFRDDVRRDMLTHLGGEDTDTKTTTATKLKAKAERVARENAPIQLATFTCD